MTEAAFWRTVADALAAGQTLVLAAVLASRGSSPGKPGAVMAVGAQGPIAGTVGGGAGESAAIERAFELLRTSESGPVLLEQTLQPMQPPGMVCGGWQCIALLRLGAGERAMVEALCAALEGGERCGWQLSASGWAAIVGGLPWPEAVGMPGAPGWRHVQAVGPTHEVWLFGGGHVSLALSALLVGLDFRVIVCEERPFVATLSANHHAHRRLQGAFEALAAGMPQGRQVFAAIMTHDWQRDLCVLKALCDKPLGYLGLLGSHHKIARLSAGLTLPACFHAPMGLPIGSHTPAEIALSIAAEMVAVRVGRQELLA